MIIAPSQPLEDPVDFVLGRVVPEGFVNVRVDLPDELLLVFGWEPLQAFSQSHQVIIDDLGDGPAETVSH